MEIKAITFDLWDTVIDDDSDEPVRAERGLRTKLEERSFQIWQALNHENDVSIESVEDAYNDVNVQFTKAWHDGFVTWTVDERIHKILCLLNLQLSPERKERLVDSLEYMEIEVPPQPVIGIHEALREVASRYPLAVVSDAIFTPGKYLRLWLERNEVLQYFDGFAFSDEVGRSKPHSEIFQSAASQLGVDMQHMVHIGDREHNDIKGAHRLGMKAILFTGTRDTDAGSTTADAVFNDYRELPNILERLAAG